MQAGLGRFFATKLRAGVLYAIFERTGDRRALEASLSNYRSARTAWAQIVARASGVYADDLSVSDWLTERGAWKDRLPLLDTDITAMEQRLASAKDSRDPRVAAAVTAVLAPPARPTLRIDHRPPPGFRPGEGLPLEVIAPGGASVTLHYRHVDQAERYASVEMRREQGVWNGAIPATYANSPFLLQYYFEVRTRNRDTVLHPGLGPELLDQPYFVVRRL